jgi:hypothetical protein
LTKHPSSLPLLRLLRLFSYFGYAVRCKALTMHSRPCHLPFGTSAINFTRIEVVCTLFMSSNPLGLKHPVKILGDESRNPKFPTSYCLLLSRVDSPRGRTCIMMAFHRISGYTRPTLSGGWTSTLMFFSDKRPVETFRTVRTSTRKNSPETSSTYTNTS